MRVVRRRRVISRLVMFGGFAMVPGRMFVVFRCSVVVLCCLLGHFSPPENQP